MITFVPLPTNVLFKNLRLLNVKRALIYRKLCHFTWSIARYHCMILSGALGVLVESAQNILIGSRQQCELDSLPSRFLGTKSGLLR